MRMVVVMVLMAVAPNNITASAETVEPVNENNNYEEYTNCDALLYSSNYTIQDYVV